MLMTAVVFAAGCTKSDDSNGGGNQGKHEYVDLGLPSGTLWATCNVGANAPEEYGDYLAWGETAPKAVYNDSTYKYCNNNLDKLTKYCRNTEDGYNGFTDYLTTLQSSDDAATINWGNEWRTPTDDEWEELLQNTTNIWTVRNGINGRLFSANGNSIFLPAGHGHPDYHHLFYIAGTWGAYWSSSLTNWSARSWSILFSDQHEVKHQSCTRATGLLVRPVRSAEKN